MTIIFAFVPTIITIIVVGVCLYPMVSSYIKDTKYHKKNKRN